MIVLQKKPRAADDYLKHVYLHMDELNQFVLFNGLNFQEFVSSVDQLSNLLILNNDDDHEESSFNMHTRLAFVEQGNILRFAKRMSDKKSAVCWIDFEEEKKLNVLSPQEQAELLYIGHKNEPLRTPFYHQLQNRFVYLQHRGEVVSKVYFRELQDVNNVIMNYFNRFIQIKERAAAFWRRKPSASNITFDFAEYSDVRELFSDGALLSLYKNEKPTTTYILEIRNVSYVHFPDEVWDDLDAILKNSAQLNIVAKV